MRILVATVVHHPEDARILHRQARALVDAGHQVVYAAPFSARRVEPRRWVHGVDLPRAMGRQRGQAILAARRQILAHAPDADVVLVHDPELLVALAGARHRLPPLVWDVHEDTAAALTLKSWMPAGARPAVRRTLHALERHAERTIHLLLAEHAYAGRFHHPHLVVPNDTAVPERVPPPGADRVVYLGSISRARGVEEMIRVAERLRGHGIVTELIGLADAHATALLDRAVTDGALDWRGFMPNDPALQRLEGALAGLSLLHDEPNYRQSTPTKIVEYMARGVPVVSTPLPLSAALVRRHGAGVVVPFADVDAATAAVLALRDDQLRRLALGTNGHVAARRHHHWPDRAARFVAQLEAWASGSGQGAQPASTVALLP